ncbi:MAG TPA: phage tail protein [Bryobacteraceae bacterium]|jgi:phage tail-like protein
MIPAALLPSIPRPPHDPTFTLLGGALGWRVLDARGVTMTDKLALALLPGAARDLTEPSGSLGGLVPPANVAINSACEIWLASAGGYIKRFDPCACSFDSVPCYHRAYGQRPALALCKDLLFIATGSSVDVRTLPALHPHAEWLSPKGLANPWQPSGITVDARHRVWVADPANGGVHRFSISGRHHKFVAGLGIARHVASDCEGRIYVIRDDQPGAAVLDSDGNLLPDATSPAAIARNFAPLPFPIDAAGRLNTSGMCPSAGGPPFDLDGNPILTPLPPLPVQLYTDGTLISGPFDSRIYQCQWHRIILTGKIPRGCRVGVSTYTSEAVLPDAQITLPDLPWRTHPAPDTQADGDWDCLIQSPPGRYLWLKLDLGGDGFFSPQIDGARIEFPRISLRRYLPGVFGEDPVSADFLDRFLSIFDTTFRSVERTLDEQARYFDPRATPADFLPWLASWIGVRLDRQLPEEQRRRILADAGETLRCRGTRDNLRRQMLDFIGWKFVAQEPNGCGDNCLCNCPGRPTCPPTPERPCCMPAPELILEHFQIRRWLFSDNGRLGDCSVLWGRRIVNRSQLNEGAQIGGTQLVTSNDPLRDPFHYTAHRFTVFVPGRLEDSDALRRSLLNLLRSESPAHTKYEVEFVRPKFRIGVQSSIGLNSVIARKPNVQIVL